MNCSSEMEMILVIPSQDCHEELNLQDSATM